MQIAHGAKVDYPSEVIGYIAIYLMWTFVHIVVVPEIFILQIIIVLFFVVISKNILFENEGKKKMMSQDDVKLQ